jgi:hypothetical protein
LWRALVLACVAAFVLLRLVGGPLEDATPSRFATTNVALVGVTGRPALTDLDRRLLQDRLQDAQVGALSIRTRYVGSCAAAGWTTLGAGRRAAVGELCEPSVSGRQVEDWAARQVAARASFGDAQLGTLAGSSASCVGAVGPGAALAAAKPDGSLAAYATAEEFLGAGAKLACPITLIDPGDRGDAIITKLATTEDVTLIVAGIGPAAGHTDPDLQVIYRLGTTLPGWLTSASTRRVGVVTLTDLTRTLITFGQGSPTSTASVDGADLEVVEDALSVPGIERHLASVRALSDAVVTGYLACGLGGAVLGLIMAVGFWRRSYGVVLGVLTAGSVFLASMMLTGAVPWQEADRPGLFVGVLFWLWIALLTPLAWLGGRLTRVPAAIVGAALTVAALTIDAALGGPMQPGSLLNSRPIFGLRWYGFGNVTFSAYASAGLLLAGYIAARLLAKGRRPTALFAVAVIGFGVVVCQGWPSMGADFGGVIALTPAVLWLLLALSGWRITWLRIGVIAAVGAVAVATVSVLDWARGADQRSHLGNFVQRVIDGDATDIVIRKALASIDTIVHPLGLLSLLLGIPLWVLLLRWAIPRITPGFPTFRPVAIACLVVAVLGTVLNDGGVSVWLTTTGAVMVAAAWFWTDDARRRQQMLGATASRAGG